MALKKFFATYRYSLAGLLFIGLLALLTGLRQPSLLANMLDQLTLTLRLADRAIAPPVYARGVGMPLGSPGEGELDPVTTFIATAKEVSDSHPSPGQVITYTLKVIPVGGAVHPGYASTVTIADTLPAEVEPAGPVTIEPAGFGQVSGGTTIDATIFLPDLATETITISVPVTVSASLEPGATFTNMAAFTLTPADSAIPTVVVNEAKAATICIGPHLIVTSSADAGAGSLREALAQVCNNGLITFDPSLAGQSLNLGTYGINERVVTIDGTASPGLSLINVFFGVGTDAALTINSLSFTGNSASGLTYIRNEGRLSLNGVTLANNQTAGLINQGQLTMNGGGLANNSFYGALYTSEKSQSILNGVTIIGNSRGIYISNNLSRVILNNTTISGNQSGVSVGDGTLLATNSTISSNEGTGLGIVGGVVELRSSIVANNSVTDCSRSSGTVTATFSLIEDGSCSSSLSGDPLLDLLKDNGGRTLTHALLPGSPARNAAPPAYCLSTDQRGVSRPENSPCDLGAYEADDPWLSLVKTVDDSRPVPGQAITYTITLSNSGLAPATGAVVSDTLPAGLTLAGPVELIPAGAGTTGSLPTLVEALTIAAGQTITVNLPVTVNGNLPLGTVITNTAAVTSTELSSGPASQVTITVSAPDLNVLGADGSIIPAGDTALSPDNGTGFASAAVSGGQIIHTFTISNAGTRDLHLTGPSPVTITGPAAADFSVTVPPATAVVAAETTTAFQVMFDPSAEGTRAATLTIISDDPDENPYTFAIEGTGSIRRVYLPVIRR